VIKTICPAVRAALREDIAAAHAKIRETGRTTSVIAAGDGVWDTVGFFAKNCTYALTWYEYGNALIGYKHACQRGSAAVTDTTSRCWPRPTPRTASTSAATWWR
jgi:hypothetical protein